jgi:ornithine carbamoyltransferase
MDHPSYRSTLWSLKDLSATQASGLITLARALERDPKPGRPMAGRHLVVLCDVPGSPSAEAFSHAALTLGAEVAHISPDAAGLHDLAAVRLAAPWLGRLYDAIECDGMDEALMQELARHAGVPVYNAVAACGHPTRLLADLMAMQDQPRRASEAMNLQVIETGPPRWRDTWSRVAMLTGASLRIGEAEAGVAPAGHQPVPDFFCDPSHPVTVDGHPSLLAAGAVGGARASLAAAQEAHHGFVIQSLLSSTMG